MKTQAELDEFSRGMVEVYRRERQRLDTIDAFMQGREDSTLGVYVPQKATHEYRQLVSQSRFNILPLVVNVMAQNLYVSGYRRADEGDNSEAWDRVWQANRMDARQTGLYQAALTYGYSYARVLKGDPDPVVTPYSPRRCLTFYGDDDAEWPDVALVFGKERLGSSLYDAGIGVCAELYDDQYRYLVVRGESGWLLDTSREDVVTEHGLGVCPFVRYLNDYGNLDNHNPGEIEPLLPLQLQLNQTTYGLLMAQHYAAFRQKYVTGLAVQEDRNGVPVAPFNVAVDKILQAESPDTKFGEFSETDLSGYLNSRDKTLLFVASVAQIPPHNLLVGSGVSNLSAEALVALQAGMQNKLSQKQTSFGESNEQLLRLGSWATGDVDGWLDTSAQVVWKDTTTRSLAQVADALGKLAIQLEIPPRGLWHLIPGVTDTDIARWEALQEESGLDSEVLDLSRLLPPATPEQQTQDEPAAVGVADGDA